MSKSLQETKIAAIAAGVTFLLYSSGFLIVFTPFPLYFVSMLYGKVIRLKTLLITFLVAVVVYFFVLPVLLGSTGSWSLAKLAFLVPGAGFAGQFSVAGAQYFGLIYLIYYMLFGFLFGEGLNNKWSLSKWFAVSSGSAFALMVIAFVIIAIGGTDLVGALRSYMSTMLGELIVAQKSAGINTEEIFALKQNAEDIISFSMAIVPSVVFLLGLLVAFANYVLGRWLVKSPVKFAHLKSLTKYSVPHYFVWLSIAMGSVYFLESYVLHINWLHYIALNSLIVLSGIYFLQGILIVAFYLKRLRGRIFKILLLVTVAMFIQIVAPVIAIMGFTDLWIDFRRLMRKKEIPNQRSVTWK